MNDPSDRVGARVSVRSLAAVFAVGIGLALVLFSENSLAASIHELDLRFPGLDKFLHWAEFTMVFLVAWTAAQRIPVRWSVRVIVAAGLTALLGAADETMQRLFADRSVELADFAADLCGAAAGVAIVSRGFATRRRGAIALASLACAAILANRSREELKDYYAGILDERVDRIESARKHYLAAAANGYVSASLFNSLAWLDLTTGLGSPSEALDFARRAATLAPRDADVLDTFGWALHAVGEDRQALEVLERASALNPHTHGLELHLGVVSLQMGDVARSERHLRRQIELAPGSAAAAKAATTLAAMKPHLPS